MHEMNRVSKGMRVVDADGAELGTVEEMKMGDPHAVTTEGQADPHEDDLLGFFARGFYGGADLPRQERERLLRVGYIKVDNEGLFGGSAYFPADKVARVTDDSVHLAVSRAHGTT